MIDGEDPKYVNDEMINLTLDFINQHLVGLSKLVEHIENKTKWPRKDLKIPIGK